MACVTAKTNIVTEKGFCIARRGDPGRAVRDRTPHDPSNFGKVLVYFNEHKHGYWVERDQLRFPKDIKTHLYVSEKPAVVDPYEGAKRLPELGPTSYHFGENLRLVRMARRISQSALSERMGVTQSAISYREQQEHCPNGEFIDAAARVLKVPAFIFFVPLGKRTWFDGAKTFINQLSSSICEA